MPSFCDSRGPKQRGWLLPASLGYCTMRSFLNGDHMEAESEFCASPLQVDMSIHPAERGHICPVQMARFHHVFILKCVGGSGFQLCREPQELGSTPSWGP